MSTLIAITCKTSGYLNVSEGNTLDISDILQITDTVTSSHLSVDQDGGADNLVQIATLFGEVKLTDVAVLEFSGALVTSV